MTPSPQVLIVGAGAAGMAAGVELAQAGVAVQILEARDRIGGRMFTKHDSSINAPVELGAEFIHGSPPEICRLLQEQNIRISEVNGDTWCLERGGLGTCDWFSEVGEILARMDNRAPDESFLGFLQRCFPDSNDESPQRKKAKQRAIAYVTGFNAADPAEVSVHWLVEEMRAEEKIEGNRAFRAPHGYQDLIEIFRRQLARAKADVQLSTAVKKVRWTPGRVEIGGSHLGGDFTLSAPQALITLPAGVLQAAPHQSGTVQFTPELPAKKCSALKKILMGKVIRVTLRFRERFWDALHPHSQASKTLADMGFLFCENDNEWFPTWWTAMPRKDPVLVGWAPFQSAERLSGKTEDFVKEKALETLGRLLPMDRQNLAPLLDAAYVHDWQSDPYSRGAYSYVKVGGLDGPAALGEAIEDTLFFAGEATDITGNTGTVHGAIASGRRAAKEILSSRPQGQPRATAP
jgi:monoamine oxidase